MDSCTDSCINFFQDLGLDLFMDLSQDLCLDLSCRLLSDFCSMLSLVMPGSLQGSSLG